MREILFRGKCVDDEMWVYGNLSKTRNIEEKPAILKPCIDFENKGVMVSCIVIPETIGQYIGLKDKNGTDIFEGDIVKRQIGHNPNQYVLYTVEFNFGEFVLVEINTKGKMFISYHNECEVVGNIYDNPIITERR